jgi:subtilisin family serine protease
MDAVAIAQSGGLSLNRFPYSEAGLTGSGQVVGVADTGLDDLSCFFRDYPSSRHYSSGLTARDGKIEMMRRKVVRYVAYADSLDYEGGHGTHVCGSLVGASITPVSPPHSCPVDNSSDGSGSGGGSGKVSTYNRDRNFDNRDINNHRNGCGCGRDCSCGCNRRHNNHTNTNTDFGPALFGSSDGIAPGAKIAFFDIGKTVLGRTNAEPMLMLPAMSTLFASTMEAGGGVQSCSWGSRMNWYSSMAAEVDQFTYEHQDLLIVFSAGNLGFLGKGSIATPGNAKNALSVGALQSRTVFHDKPKGQSGDSSNNRNDDSSGKGEFSVSFFSSLGPTRDGRIKPDVIAPGVDVRSSFAGKPQVMQDVQKQGDWRGGKEGHCGVHQMSGTSMATPVVAGMAVLLRQYFMDPRFWASLCDERHVACTRGQGLVPSGYLLKGLLLHSCRAVKRYSDTVYDNTALSSYRSFALKSPPDVFQVKNRLCYHQFNAFKPDFNRFTMIFLSLWSCSAIASQFRS